MQHCWLLALPHVAKKSQLRLLLHPLLLLPLPQLPLSKSLLMPPHLLLPQLPLLLLSPPRSNPALCSQKRQGSPLPFLLCPPPWRACLSSPRPLGLRQLDPIKPLRLRGTTKRGVPQGNASNALLDQLRTVILLAQVRCHHALQPGRPGPGQNLS